MPPSDFRQGGLSPRFVVGMILPLLVLALVLLFGVKIMTLDFSFQEPVITFISLVAVYFIISSIDKYALSSFQWGLDHWIESRLGKTVPLWIRDVIRWGAYLAISAVIVTVCMLLSPPKPLPTLAGLTP